MNRRNFLINTGIGISCGLIATAYSIQKGLPFMNQLLKSLQDTDGLLQTQQKMPVLFIGHGSPMNAIANNSYTQKLTSLGQSLPRPKCILMISAHWLTQGTYVTQSLRPQTIHDFGGFPQELFDVQYPAPGHPEAALLVQQTIHNPTVSGDREQWGLDHGTWSVLKHMYPQADIPVVQLSIDINKPPEYHFEIGQQLSALRDKGVMIMGSGNLVHNLRKIQWDEKAKPYEWATEFDEWTKTKLVQRDYKALLNDVHLSEAGRLSVPSMDHYYPLNYILGAATPKDELKFEFEEMQNGSISMRSISLS